MSSRRALAACSLAWLSWQRPVWAEEPVTVTVQGRARPRGELPNEPFVSTSRVTRERLAAPAARLSEVLRSEAGVQISETGGLGAPATAAVRGATAAQTPVYLAGVRLNDLVGGVADLSTLPLWLIDHVDLYRGNAPFDVDELGIGGALVLEPRRPRSREAVAGASLGSFGTRGAFGYFALVHGDDSVLAGISAERADNDYPFVDDRGTLFRGDDDARRTRENADSRLVDGWILARSRPSPRASVEVVYNRVQREQGAPKLALVPSERARAELVRTLSALTARLWLDDAGELTLRTSWLDSTVLLSDPARELGNLTERTRVSGRRVSQQALWALRLTERLRLGLSASGDFENLARRDDAAFSGARASTLRGAGRLDWSYAGLSVFGLLASQCRAISPGASGCRNIEPTGRVGLGWLGAGHTAYLTVSRYQRTPALGELYGAGIVVRGNPELRPELGTGVDFGGRVTKRVAAIEAHAEAALFIRQASDLVAYARTAQGYVVPLNVRSARIAGLESTLGASLVDRATVDVSLTLLDPRDTTRGDRLRNDYLPFTSRLVAAPRLTVTSGPLSTRTLARADLSLDATYLSNRFADAAGLVVIPEQTTFGATAVLSWWSGALVTRARLANALNAARFDVVGYPLPGRSVYVSAEVHAP